MKQAIVHLSEESENVSNIYNAKVNRIIEIWSERRLLAFISLAHDKFTLKIAQEILRYIICKLMTSLP